jgi:hypothetical protein
MSVLELKSTIHKKIDTINDLDELLDINLSLDWFIADQLTMEEKKVIQRLKQVPNDIMNNSGITRETVTKNSKKWLLR